MSRVELNGQTVASKEDALRLKKEIIATGRCACINKQHRRYEPQTWWVQNCKPPGLCTKPIVHFIVKETQGEK